jgi:hypothetical protein
MTTNSVAVFGSSQASSDSTHYRLAGDLGAVLARRGAEVRCGGYGGVMEAVAAGAKREGGQVFGCTLKWFSESRIPNRHLDQVHEAANLHTRIECLLRGVRGAVVLPGGVGTMNELFWVWTMLLLDREEGPQAIALLGEPWAELMSVLSRNFEFDGPIRSLVSLAATPEEAADIVLGAGGAK